VNTPSDPDTYAIIGVAMTVHSELGRGFLEAVYQEAMEMELKLRHLPYVREVSIPIRYRGTILRTTYRADFVVFDDIILELKALASISGGEEAQLIHYLKATGLRRGLLLNFGASSLQFRRVVRSRGGRHPQLRGGTATGRHRAVRAATVHGGGA
jgi:GxxExxY protein